MVQVCAGLSCCAAPRQAEDVQEVHLAAAAGWVLALAPSKEAAHLCRLQADLIAPAVDIPV